MIIKKTKKILNTYYKYMILFLLFSSFTGFFTNFYLIFSRDYYERMVSVYGYCEGVSYGYVNFVKSNFLNKDKKVFIINFDVKPAVDSLFVDMSIDYSKKNLIFLNFDKNNFEILDKFHISLDDYQLIHNVKNCFYFKKND